MISHNELSITLSTLCYEALMGGKYAALHLLVFRKNTSKSEMLPIDKS